MSGASGLMLLPGTLGLGSLEMVAEFLRITYGRGQGTSIDGHPKLKSMDCGLRVRLSAGLLSWHKPLASQSLLTASVGRITTVKYWSKPLDKSQYHSIVVNGSPFPSR